MIVKENSALHNKGMNGGKFRCNVQSANQLIFGRMESSEVNTHHICVDCGRQFIEHYETSRGYSDEVKRECLKMYVNGMGFPGIERVKGVHHTTVIYWVKQVGENLPDAYEPERPQVGELDELETFVGSKKTKFGCGPQLTTSQLGS